ncbi:N-alpha-acetyltransferase 35 NatC auxiliary subunit [Balamuthia mandrillaris]
MSSTFESDKPSKHSEWKSIDEDLLNAANDMEAGQLLSVSGFGLMEAMSAIEIMDPKMDSGVNVEGVYNLHEARKLGLLPQTELSIPQVLFVVDRLLGCEATWYSGFSLAQTVLTCLYMHEPHSIPNKWLRIYCTALMKSCDVVRTLVMMGDIYEEEDFVTNTFGFNLCMEVEESQVLKDIKEAEEELFNIARSSSDNKKNSNNKGKGTEGEEEALLARFRFRRAFYVALFNLERVETKSLEAARKALKYALAQLPIIQRTLSIGSSALSSSSPSLLENVFDPRLCRRMPSPVPPRTIELLSPEAAIDAFDKILRAMLRLCDCLTVVGLKVVRQDIIAATNESNTNADSKKKTKKPKKKGGESGGGGMVAEVDLEEARAAGREGEKIATVSEPGRRNLISAIQEFLLLFTYDAPDIITRSRLKIFCFHSRKILGVRAIQDVLRDCLKEFPLPPDVIDNPLTSSFFDKVCKVLVLQFKLLCFNRSRQRRKFVRCLDDWAVLLHEAESLDQLIAQRKQEKKKAPTPLQPDTFIYWFFSWTMDQTILVMIHYLLLGFELEIYNPLEYCMLFWYLDYLFSVQLKNQLDMRERTRQVTGAPLPCTRLSFSVSLSLSLFLFLSSLSLSLSLSVALSLSLALALLLPRSLSCICLSWNCHYLCCRLYFSIFCNTQQKVHLRNKTGGATTGSGSVGGGRGKRKGGGGRGSKRGASQQTTSTTVTDSSTPDIKIPPMEHYQYFIYAQRKLCSGLFRMIIGANMELGQDPSYDPTPYGSMESRFFNRFSVFHRLPQPQPLHPTHFRSTTNYSTFKVEEIYGTATENLREAKASIEEAIRTHPFASSSQKEEESFSQKTYSVLRSVEKVIQENLASAEQLAKSVAPSNKGKGAAANSKKSLRYDFSVHKHYPIISFC